MANRKRWLESQGKNVAQEESWQNEWHDNEYQGAMAKAPPCTETTLKTPLPRQSSPSSRDEEGQSVSVEDRRRRRVRMQRYLEDSEDLKVGVTELQEQMEISEEVGVSTGQIAQQAMNESGQNIFETFG